MKTIALLLYALVALSSLGLLGAVLAWRQYIYLPIKRQFKEAERLKTQAEIDEILERCYHDAELEN